MSEDETAAVSLRVAVFVINPDPDADRDRELTVGSVEIEDGTLWVYVNDDPPTAPDQTGGV